MKPLAKSVSHPFFFSPESRGEDFENDKIKEIFNSGQGGRDFSLMSF